MATNKCTWEDSVKNPAVYQRIYESSLPEVLVSYSDYRFISANPKACSLFGLTEAELCSHFMTDLVDYSDPRLINLVEVAERTGKTNGEITLVRENGSKFACEINSSTFRDENGQLIIDIIIQELNDRRKEEEELSKNFALYQLAIEATNDGIWDMEMRTNRIFLSTNARNWFGLKDNRTIHLDEFYNNIIHKDDIPVMENELDTVTNGYRNIIDIEFRVNTLTAGCKWIRLRGKVVLREREGKVIRMLGTFSDISYQKQIEKELEWTQKEFKSYFDYGTVGQAIIGPDKSWIAINQKAYQLLGYSKDELNGLTWIDLSHPEDVQESLDLFKQVLEGKIDNYNIEKRYIRKDGSIMFVHLYVVCSRNEDRSVKHFLASFLDITEQKKYEESIRNERKILRTLVDNLPVSIYIIDKEGRKVLSNKTDWENIGCNSETEVLGKTDIELYPVKIGERGHSDNLFVINDKASILNKEEEFVDNEGRLKWLLTTKVPLFDTNNQISGLIGIGIDITDQKNLQKNIAESETFYRTLINTTPNGVIVTDMTGKITFITKRAYQILRIPEVENQIGESVFNLIAPESLALVEASFMKVAEGSTSPQSEEFKCWTYDNSETWIEVAGSLLLDASGNKMGLMTVCRDITYRKKIERDLVSAKNKAEENDKLKTALLRNISHEIRTPLNGIMGFSSLLKESVTGNEMISSFVETIQVCSEQLLSIITDLIDISSIEAKITKLSKSEVDVNQVLQDIRNQFHLRAKSRNLELILKVGLNDNDLYLDTDKTKLVQIISNLLNNAIKFTPEGQIEFGYTADTSELVFYVSDTGIGIPTDYHSRIFDTFFQVENELSRKFDGTGIGLSICKAYVELLNGTIWVDSEPGKGSTFYFTIPYDHVSSLQLDNVKGLSNQNLLIKKSVTILVAEDDKDSSFLFKNMLADPLIKIISVENGFDAVSECVRTKGIDLVFMDLNMPQMDGYAATKKIRESYPDLPIIAQTAYMINSTQASDNGFTDYIRKPFSKSDLIIKINKYLSDQYGI